MAMSLPRWLLIALIALVIFGVVVSAQDDDEDDEKPIGETVQGQNIEEVAEGVDAEDAAEDLEDDSEEDKETDTLGLKATSWFPKYADMKVPAGERVEVLVPISNAAGNPGYEIALVAGHIATLDHSRFIQNFSAQVYSRKMEGGETATVKYSVTPDVQLDPMEYAFVIAAYVRSDENNTYSVTAYNGTMFVQDPAGFDFKGNFTLLAFFGGIAYAAFWYLNKQSASKPAAPVRSASPSVAVEQGTGKSTAFDPDFVDPSHLKFLEAKNRKRSASPKGKGSK